MRLIVLATLLIFCANSNGLDCLFKLHEDLFKERLEDFNPAKFFDTIEHSLDQGVFNYGDPCRIKFHIQFSDEPFLRVTGTNDLQESKLEDSYIQINTYIDGIDEEKLRVIHTIEHACSSDLCDREFVSKFKKTLEWFFGARYANLSAEVSKFLLVSGETSDDEVNCFESEEGAENEEDAKSESCSSGQCHADFDISTYDDDAQYSLTRYCAGEDAVTIEGIESILVFDLGLTDMEWDFRVYCNYSECNDKQTVTDLWDAFYEGYNASQIIEKLTHESVEEKESSTTEQLKSTSTVEPTSSVSTTEQLKSTSSVKPISSVSTPEQLKSTSTVEPTSSLSTTEQLKSTSATTTSNVAQHIRSGSANIYLNLLVFIFILIL